MDEAIISNVVAAIENGYRKASKHSEALEGIDILTQKSEKHFQNIVVSGGMMNRLKMES